VKTERLPCPSGVLVIDKPKGPTSHDVVAILRRALGTRQIGHCGTLDPMATGVLVVAVEEATKLVPWLTADDKGYEATIRLGVATDSLDADGTETARVPVDDEVAAALGLLACHGGGDHAELPPVLADALANERARTQQIPPVVSAIRIGGERAHDLARRGEAPELGAREVAVKSLRVVGGGVDPAPHLKVTLDVAKGYFVRALARDLAASLGTVGHLTALRRTRSGAFDIAAACLLDHPADGDRNADRDAHRARQGARLRASLLPLEEAVARALPVSVLDADGVRAAGFGRRIPPEHLRDPRRAPSAWLDEDGRLVAIGEVDEAGLGRVLRGFPRAS